MIQRIKYRLTGAPTPWQYTRNCKLSWCWDGVLVAQGTLHTPGLVQWISAGIAAVLLVLAVKFWFTATYVKTLLTLLSAVLYPHLRWVVWWCLLRWLHLSISYKKVWLASVALHVVFLVSFLYHRAKNFEIHHMVPLVCATNRYYRGRRFLFCATQS